MKKTSIISLILLLLILSSIGVLSGYYIGEKNISEKPNPKVENMITDPSLAKNTNEEDLKVGPSEEELIGPNTILEFKTYYSECKHEIVENIEPERHMINMTREQLEGFVKNNQTNWKIEFFSNNKVVILVEKNFICQEHYVVGEKDGKIAVFRINDKGERVLDKIFNDAPISLLKEIDQEKLEKGIITDSKEELSNVLEDYIS